MEETELRTISRDVDGNSKRSAVKQNAMPQKPIYKFKNSHSGSSRANVPPTILEIDMGDGPSRSGHNSVRSSKISSNSSKSARSAKYSANNNSYENGAYDGPLPRNGFENRSTYSNQSSRNPSVQSLEVQKEQYCCTKNWSPCERKLVVSIGVLGAVIIVLVIAVGFLAGNEEGTRAAFHWSF